MRVIQPTGTKGSLKWLQLAIAQDSISLQPPGLPIIEWRSPLASDKNAEYRDEAFLELLGLAHLGPALREFWPQKGPQWDALGVTKTGPVLVEAKAHIREFFSPASQAGERSKEKIRIAFKKVQDDLGIRPRADWSKVYYQYANRLAHLWWLREQGVDAKLVFVSFLSAEEMGGPRAAETWEAAFAAAHYAMGIPEKNKLREHVHHVMPDVRQIRSFR